MYDYLFRITYRLQYNITINIIQFKNVITKSIKVKCTVFSTYLNFKIKTYLSNYLLVFIKSV